MPRDLFATSPEPVKRQPRDLFASDESPASRGLRSELSAITQNPGAHASQERSGVLGRIDSAMRGAADVLSFGLADEISAGLGSLTGIGGESGDYAGNLEQQRAIDRADAQDRPTERILGQLTGAVTGGVGLARAGLSPTTRAIDAGWRLPMVAGASAGEGAILSALQGFGSGEGGFENRAENAADSAKWGAAAGAILPPAIAAGGAAVRRAITPFTSSPERQRLVDILANEGVGLTAGQQTGSKALRYAESQIGGSRAAEAMERQAEEFTSAALQRAGINARRATPDVLDAAFARIGGEFDRLAANNQLRPDQQLVTDLRSVLDDYRQLVPESARAPIVENTIGDLVGSFRAGPLDGAAYQSLRSRLDRAARSAGRDPELSGTLRDLRSVLDDGMERSIQTTNPGDAGAWQNVRREYRNMLVLERAATSAGENAAQGLISPSALRNAAVAKHGRRAYARGTGDFADLARAGEGTMKALPDSGTASRIKADGLGGGLLSALGGAGGYAIGDASTAIIGALMGSQVPRLAGRALMSEPVQRYLANRVAPGGMSDGMRSILNVLTNSGQSAVTGRRLPAP